MEERDIVELFWERDEKAISLTAEKYGRLLCGIANNILSSKEDAEECVNDTYVRLWNAIPPSRPLKLSAFAARITRNLALDRYRSKNSKHNFSNVKVAFEELEPCLCDNNLDAADQIALRDAVNGFLEVLPKKSRVIFMRRYWYFSSVRDIARDYGYTVSDVKVTLMRTRDKFAEHLKKEGILNCSSSHLKVK